MDDDQHHQHHHHLGQGRTMADDQHHHHHLDQGRTMEDALAGAESDSMADEFARMMLTTEPNMIAEKLATDIERTRRFLYWAVDHKCDPLSWCSSILATGSSLELVLDHLRSSQARCSVSWSSSHIAYRCKTCAVSITSCICSHCFDHSKHEGHDYTIYRCELGGCCDCGDVNAWAKEGFCSLHSGIYDPADSIGAIPIAIRPRLQLVVSFAILTLLDAMHSDEQETVKASATWLKEIASLSDGVRSFVVAEILGHSIQRRSSQVQIVLLPNALEDLDRTNAYDNGGIIRYMIEYAVDAPAEVEHALAYFWLECTFDICFKIGFARVFLSYYPRYLHRTLTMPSRALDALPVQLFSILEVANKLSREENLLAILIDSCDDFLSRAIDDGALNLLHPLIVKHLYWKVLHDLTFVLSQQVPSQELKDRPDLISKLVQFLSVLQAAPVLGYPTNRAASCWESLYRLELDLMVMFNGLLDGIHHVDADLPFPHHLITLTQTVIASLVASADDRSNSSDLSLSLPLHRALTLSLLHLKWKHDTSPEHVPGLNAEFASLFVKDLFRTMTFLGNVKARRVGSQGAPLDVVVSVYESSAWNYFSSDLDLIALQIGLVIIHPDTFWYHLLQCFDLQPASDDMSVEQRTDWFLSALHILTLVFNLSTPMTRLWVPPDRFAKLEIIHLLAGSDKTFSQLKEGVSCFIVEESHILETILLEVAYFHKPTHMKPGLYSLKQEYWAAVDPNYPHFTAATRNAVQCRLKKQSVSSVPPHSESSIVKCMVHRPIVRHLCSRSAFSMIYLTLSFMDACGPSKTQPARDCLSIIYSILTLISMELPSNRGRSPVGLCQKSKRAFGTKGITFQGAYQHFSDDFIESLLMNPGNCSSSMISLLLRTSEDRSALDALLCSFRNLSDNVGQTINRLMRQTCSDGASSAAPKSDKKGQRQQRQREMLKEFERRRQCFSVTQVQSSPEADHCSICGEELTDDTSVVATFMEKSNRCQHSYEASIASRKKFVGVAIHTCGHRQHLQCFSRFLKTQRATAHACPICRRLCNSWLPVVTSYERPPSLLSPVGGVPIESAKDYLNLALFNIAFHEMACRPLGTEKPEPVADSVTSALKALDQRVSIFTTLFGTARGHLQLDSDSRSSLLGHSLAGVENIDLCSILQENDIDLFIIRHWILTNGELREFCKLLRLGYVADVAKSFSAYVQAQNHESLFDSRQGFANMANSPSENNPLRTVVTESLQFIRRHSICYLRRMYLAFQSFIANPIVPEISQPDRDSSAFDAQFETLRSGFKLPTIYDALASISELVVGGIEFSAPPSPGSSYLLSSPTLPPLISMPSIYQTFFTDFMSRIEVCMECKTPHAALCLVCSAICYFGYSCCHLNSVQLDVYSHASACGASQGIFLLANECMILLTSGGQHALWGSIYLDAHGEEDFELTRGNPLYLSQERYEDLNRLWWTKSLIYHTNDTLGWSDREVLL